MIKNTRETPVTNESRESLPRIMRLRIPWLILGLMAGTLVSITVSKFEKILSENISLAFFLPLIVYMSDAVGTQTETMYVRLLARSKVGFLKNVLKELMVGAELGAVLGAGVGLIAWLWLSRMDIALTVGLTMFINVAIAPLIALIIPEILFKEHTDPALGAGPITTVIQDFISLLIYFAIATLIVGLTF